MKQTTKQCWIDLVQSDGTTIALFEGKYVIKLPATSENWQEVEKDAKLIVDAVEQGIADQAGSTQDE